MNERSSIETRLLEWRQINDAAVRAEAEARAMQLGHVEDSLVTHQLLLRAKQLRAEADREFGAILRTVNRAEADEHQQPKLAEPGSPGRASNH